MSDEKVWHGDTDTHGAPPDLYLLQHRHSWQPYALVDDDCACFREPGRINRDSCPIHGDETAFYYMGYRCKECGEAGYRVP